MAKPPKKNNKSQQQQMIVKKANLLNMSKLYGEHESTVYPLLCTYDAYRMWLIAVALYQQTGSPEFEISFNDYAEMIGIVKPRTENIRNSLHGILHADILIPKTAEKKSYKMLLLFASFEIDEERRCIIGTLNQVYLEMLNKNLSGQFTLITLESINNCKRSLCAARLYELCKQHKYKGYLSYNNIRVFLAEVGYNGDAFETRVLNKWIDIVNNGTDIHIACTLTRGASRKITSLRFTITDKQKCFLEEKKGKNCGEKEIDDLISFGKKMLHSDIVAECLRLELPLSVMDAAEIMELAYAVVQPSIVPNAPGGHFDANRDKRTWRVLSNIKLLEQMRRKGNLIESPKSWLKAAIQEDYSDDPL